MSYFSDMNLNSLLRFSYTILHLRLSSTDLTSLTASIILLVCKEFKEFKGSLFVCFFFI